MTDPAVDADDQLVDHISAGGDPPEGDGAAAALAHLRAVGATGTRPVTHLASTVRGGRVLCCHRPLHHLGKGDLVVAERRAVTCPLLSITSE